MAYDHGPSDQSWCLPLPEVAAQSTCDRAPGLPPALGPSPVIAVRGGCVGTIWRQLALTGAVSGRSGLTGGSQRFSPAPAGGDLGVIMSSQEAGQICLTTAAARG